MEITPSLKDINLRDAFSCFFSQRWILEVFEKQLDCIEKGAYTKSQIDLIGGS
jgi:hypothetical protein